MKTTFYRDIAIAATVCAAITIAGYTLIGDALALYKLHWVKALFSLTTIAFTITAIIFTYIHTKQNESH